MKRILAVAVLVLAMSGMARAQTLPQNFNNMEFFVSGCSTFSPQTPAPAQGAVCNDTVTGVQYFWNGSAFVVPNSIVTSQHAFVRITASLCSTSGVINNPCAEPTVGGLPFADTNYTVTCACVGTPTGVPGAITIAKTAASAGLASSAVVSLYAASAATASCTEVDCNFFHN